MIRFPCDRCERILCVAPELAGTKIECPDCGDMNIVPMASNPVTPGASAPVAPAGAAPGQTPVGAGTAETMSGESMVMVVRPSLWRVHPFSFLLLAIAPIAFAVAGRALGWQFVVANWWVWWLAIPALGWLVLFVWWFFTSMFVGLEVTTKRCTHVEGLFFKSRRDVFHRDIESVTLVQRNIDHIFNVGTVQISSNETDASEIEIPSVPRPRRVKAAIEQYIPGVRRR